jgi:hypothetical protein
MIYCIRLQYCWTIAVAMIKNLNQDMSLRETEIPVATATQLEAYLFPEDTIHPPLSDRTGR